VGNGIPIIIVSKKKWIIRGIYPIFRQTQMAVFCSDTSSLAISNLETPMSRFSGSMNCEPNQSKERQIRLNQFDQIVWFQNGRYPWVHAKPIAFPKAIRLSIAFTRVMDDFGWFDGSLHQAW
jgi:hypothetical protein